MTRTKNEIIKQTNELAKVYSEYFNFTVTDNFKFYNAKELIAKICWSMACDAQSVITGVDAKNIELQNNNLTTAPPERK